MSYCWYCEREFEDDKVLLSHQKAKHFKCSHCPRRLNTAGGLAVHIDQVHKLGTDRIENAIPGRDSFDVEIYGMEGIPAADLRAWRRKKEIEAGVTSADSAPRPQVDRTVIPQDVLRAQLRTHKDLMEGRLPPSAALGLPPPGMGGPPPFMPPPGLAPPPGMPPLPAGMPMPPPGFPMGLPFPPPPGMLPGFPPMPGMLPPPPGMAGPPPMPIPGAVAPGAPASAPKAAYSTPDSSIMLKADQKLLYGDNDVSPEEKRAKDPKYAKSGDTEMAEPVIGPDGPVGERKDGIQPVGATSGRAKATDFL